MMMALRLWTSMLALILVLCVVLAPAIAQKAKDGSAFKPDDQMSRMMTMMEQMRDQMKRMHDDMAGMKGMGPMQGRMDHMAGMMGQMNGMMREHHAQMQKGCPGMPSADRPKPGG
jgi:signal recognition particle GTPase